MNIHTHSVYCIYHLNVNHLGRFLFLDCRIVCSNERNFPQNVCAHAHTHFAYQKKKIVLFAWATTIDNEQCSKFCFCLFVCTLHPSCTLQNAFAERVARINELREENEKSYHKSHEMSRKKSLQQQYIVMCAVQTHRRTQNKTKQKNKHL